MSSLSNYKPSTLLVEIPDNNIDNKLGVKNLVVQSRNPPPITKPRVTIEHWSANNGSIIYAQPNALKNGFNSNTNGISSSSSNGGRLNFKKQQVTRVHNTNDPIEIDGYSDGGTTINSAQTQMPTMAPINNGELNIRSTVQNQDNPFNGFHSKNNNLNSQPNGHLLETSSYNGKSTANNSNLTHLGEDLNNSSSTNWSNGTCKTSDLLF